jgi:hypothetical protein
MRPLVLLAMWGVWVMISSMFVTLYDVDLTLDYFIVLLTYYVFFTVAGFFVMDGSVVVFWVPMLLPLAMFGTEKSLVACIRMIKE